jgi:hypothetical protein
MKELPTDDKLFGKGTVRADGCKIHPTYSVEVKTPAESKGPWDYLKVRATIPADDAFRSLSKGGCPPAYDLRPCSGPYGDPHAGGRKATGCISVG